MTNANNGELDSTITSLFPGSVVGNNDSIFGSSDFLEVVPAEDQIFASVAAGPVFSGPGNDKVKVVSSDPHYLGKGDDEGDAIGFAGGAFINGNNDNDTLYGGAGSDTLIGGKGKDNIYGGGGLPDFLTGGRDADNFGILAPSKSFSEITTIADFNEIEGDFLLFAKPSDLDGNFVFNGNTGIISFLPFNSDQVFPMVKLVGVTQPPKNLS